MSKRRVIFPVEFKFKNSRLLTNTIRVFIDILLIILLIVELELVSLGVADRFISERAHYFRHDYVIFG